jgi:beta-phosphoglucomutase-like phosphatase (HAD superfamily)
MDGVLIHSTELHLQAWEQYLAPFSADVGWIRTQMLGKRNDQIVRKVFGEGLSEAEVFEHGAAKERLYRELMTPVFDEHLVRGLRPLLEAAEQAGVPCALGTNAEPANVQFVLERSGYGKFFRTTVDGQQVEHAKPHPEIYLTAAARLGADPARCVVFEDSPGGMAAARAAGMRLVALLTTLTAAPEADLAIADFEDERLAAWLAAAGTR